MGTFLNCEILDLHMTNKYPENAVIVFENLTKRFKYVTAVDNLSLTVEKGDIVGYLGPNGAGKTTTIKLLANLIHADAGRVLVRTDNGLEDITADPRRILKRVGFLIDQPHFYEDMTAAQVLSYFAKLKDYPRDKISDRVREVLDLMGMLKWKDEKIKTYSKGMVQKIGIAQAIIHDPDIVVLDEPQSGLDPLARVQVRKILSLLQERGKTIFLSSHMLKEVSEIANKAALIYKGQLLAYDTLENLGDILIGGELDFEIIEPLPYDAYEGIIDRLDKLVEPYVGDNIFKVTGKHIQYLPQKPGVRVYFDGKRESRHAVIKALANSSDISIIAASVDSTSRLEKLYIEMMEDAENGSIVHSGKSLKTDSGKMSTPPSEERGKAGGIQ